MSISFLFLASALALTLSSPAWAHSRGQEAPPEVRAIAISEPIDVDGLLKEDAWMPAPVATGFTQREPKQGTPATETTKFRVAYTDKMLYIGIQALDSDPDAVIAGEMGRDVSLFKDDSVIILLDTFHDHRNGFFFEINPNGSRIDALLTDEG